MFVFEKKWCLKLFDAIMPSGSSMPGISTISLDKFWKEFEQNAPPLMKLGVRFAVFYLTLRPFFSPRYLKLFPQLSTSAQDLFLTEVNESRFYLERQLVTTLKAVACMAYFDHPKMRLMVE
ncbi:MAG: hypothetical protein A2X86_18610 [Bdellovibrionales bacterium GWA2_49_15]|nr:MAG: hypothetical protein A2X86_18610 [Bdellovibrionales bacterium GWA2_49_15]HAZ11537.1 hypothetical protein [Bdellovibrionales bacterium]